MGQVYIKNMVCHRCIEAVQEVLERLDIKVLSVVLGEARLTEELSPKLKEELSQELEIRGFDLLEDKTSRIVEKIKNLIIEIIHHKQVELATTFSKYLEREIGKDYSYLSRLFSSVEGITIEQFIILQKIEKVKELLIYDELSLSQISYQLDYSSVQHLSNQFKKVIGMSPSNFKKLQLKSRKPLDKIKS